MMRNRKQARAATVQGTDAGGTGQTGSVPTCDGMAFTRAHSFRSAGTKRKPAPPGHPAQRPCDAFPKAGLLACGSGRMPGLPSFPVAVDGQRSPLTVAGTAADSVLPDLTAFPFHPRGGTFDAALIVQPFAPHKSDKPLRARCAVRPACRPRRPRCPARTDRSVPLSCVSWCLLRGVVADRWRFHVRSEVFLAIRRPTFPALW